MSNQEKNYTLFAQNIVSAVAKKIFAKDSALVCLAKSDMFFKELTGIFNKLNLYGITPEKFSATICLLPQSADKNRLLLCAEIYQNYVDTMKKNGFKIPHAPREIKTFNPNFAKNKDIKLRLELLKRVFEDKRKPNFESIKSDSIAYMEFPDIQAECDFVIQIIKGKSCEDKNYRDFAIFVDKSESRQKFADLLKASEIPVVSSIYNENYENLKHKTDVYEKISSICKELKIEEFNFENFKNIDHTANLNYISKSQKEICLEQLDEVLKSLLEEIFSDSYTIDKITNLQERNRKSLSESIFWAFNIINESEREILAMEFGAIKSFYANYKENNFAKAIETVIMRFFKLFDDAPELKDAVAGKIKSLNELQELYDNILKTTPDFSAFKEILEWLPQDTQKDKNAVRLASVSAGFKEHENYKYIFVSGLTENNFPGSNTSYPFISETTNQALNIELQKINPSFNLFLQTDDNFFKQRFYSVCEVMSHAEEKMFFTTHSYETKKTVQPSIFFKTLKTKDNLNFYTVDEQNNSAYNAERLKNDCCIKISQNNIEKACVIGQNDVLKLNASAISAFQSCPRKYYYKNLLNLKETSTFSASYGSIVHAVFEVMNKNYLDKYGKETALALGEILFNAKADTQRVLDSGFGQIDADLVCATDDLSLEEMKENFKNAMENFDTNGYFAQKPSIAVCEKEFSFTLDELPNVVFDGRIDVILTDNNGEISVVDYKTGKNKVNSLSYAISENGVNFKTKTGKDPSNVEVLQNSYDYQIPVYYLACQNSSNLSEFKDKIANLGFLYVRPKNKHDGCDDDFINAENIELYKDKIIQNIKETIIDKIRSEKEFKPQSGFGCDYCSYKFLCIGGADDE